MRDKALIVVAKEPVPGRTKTRLCPPLTPASAAELYRCLLLDTLALMQRLEGVDHTLAYTPASARDYFARLSPDGFRLVAQEGADLGARLANALGHHFALGYGRVAIMNSDGPTLPLACLEEAFAGLEEADVTLGQGHDGGYYLIGMKRLHPGLFQGIDWSTERVIPQTLAACRRLGLAVRVLPEWYDVDVAEDLARLHRELEAAPEAAPRTWAFLREHWPGLEPPG
ncbi:MAG: TIGR04282 family arsenosugar biosynthesis glycosyltransferase [Anaerolineae bacterium]